MSPDNPADFELDLDRALKEHPEVVPKFWARRLLADMKNYLDKPADDAQDELATLMGNFDAMIDAKVFKNSKVGLQEFLMKSMDEHIVVHSYKFYMLFMAMRAANPALYTELIHRVLSHFHCMYSLSLSLSISYHSCRD